MKTKFLIRWIFFLTAFLTFYSCSNFTLARELGISSQSIQINPASTTLMTNGSQSFSATGGLSPYTFSVIEGAGTIGTIDIASGYFVATSIQGEARVRVSDSDTPPNTADAIITVTDIEPLTIVPPVVSIPANNELVFSAIGGVSPYEYSLVSGSAGSVTPAGRYRAPANMGVDQIKVTDNSGNSRIATITITAAQPLTIDPKSLILLAGGDDFQFSASGGTSPYTYKRISGNGNITSDGIYSVPGAADYGVIEVKDNLGLTANAYVRVVAIGPLEILPGDPIKEITVEQFGSFTFTTSGGAPPYSYSIVSGPGSGSIDSSTGKYIAPDTLGQDAIVRVTDSNFPTPDTTEATVHIAPAAPGNLAADGSAGAPSQALLTWDNNASGEDDFTIEMRILGEVILTEIDGIGAGSTSYMYGGLSPNVPYIFRIRAQHGTPPDTVYSEWSNEAFGFSN